MKMDLNMYVMRVTNRFNSIHGIRTRFKFILCLDKNGYRDYIMEQMIPRKFTDVINKWTEYDIKVENYTKPKGKSLEKYYNLKDITYVYSNNI